MKLKKHWLDNCDLYVGLFALGVALSCLLMLIKESQAESLPVRIIASETTSGFNCYDTHEYYKMSAYIIESQTGVRIRPRLVCRLLDSFNVDIFKRYDTFFEADKELKQRLTPTKWISGGLTNGVNIFTGGLAYVGLWKGFGWSFVVPKTERNEDRRTWAIVNIAHELGHILGAEHDESEGSIMSTVALARLKENPNQTLAFTAKSIREIRREVRFRHRTNRYRSNTVCYMGV
jgi:hypothetical protein